ncbi:MAG: YihY/virulence factor BrkB family protein [Proteobacteria bacterium]|nr:YihY/virulence factor BrkB family protein [Pseudomonadota bacterium]
MLEKLRDIPETARAADRAIWRANTSAMTWWQRWPLRALRLGYAVLRDWNRSQISMRATGLVYTTLLSLVPLLAISFSILKGFGVHNQIEPMLLRLLAPLGDKAVEITANVIDFVDNMKVGVLGSVGFVLLFFTVISLMSKIERAFNHVWRIHRERNLTQRVRDYISVLVLGPALVFGALGITASLTNNEIVQSLSSIEPLGTVVAILGRVIPYLMTTLAFTFIYLYMPNTRVHPRAAFVGALFAAVLWSVAGWGFASFVAQSPNYAAIYSGFATLFVFLLWLYMSWIILLTGASVSFFVQNPDYMGADPQAMVLGNRAGERVALLVAQRIGRAYYQGEAPPSTDGLAQALRVPPDIIEPMLTALEEAGLIARVGENQNAFLPAAPWEMTPVKAALDAIRGVQRLTLVIERLPEEAAVAEIVKAVDDSTESALHGRTLKDLATDGETAA